MVLINLGYRDISNFVSYLDLSDFSKWRPFWTGSEIYVTSNYAKNDKSRKFQKGVYLNDIETITAQKRYFNIFIFIFFFYKTYEC